MTDTNSIEIVVNGKNLAVPSGSNISGVLGLLEIAADHVAVELNRTLVRKRDWDATRVETGARVEIVEFVGGG